MSSEIAPVVTWQVVCNELNHDAKGEVVILTGLDRATATTAARKLQETWNPDVAETDEGVNFFIRKDAK